MRKVATDVCQEPSRGDQPLTVWLDEAEIRPGQSIPRAVNAGLETSRFFVLFLSPSYFESKSGWTDAEWHAALHVDPDNRRGRILPVLIADCPKIPPLLRHLRIIDMREPRYGEGLRELLSILRDEPQPCATIYKGQLILAGRRVARETLVAERAVVDAEPGAATEFLSCNLLPVERPPSSVYTAPIAMSLRTPRLDGTYALPPKALVKQVIREAQEEARRRPFTPTFRIVGEEIVTFHDLEAEDGVFAPVIERDKAGRDRTEEWLSDPDDRKVITSLLNMAVSRHAYRHGLKEDNERQHRFFFPPKDGLSWSVTWKPFHNKVPREVAGRRRGPKG
ncbi:MAG: toll/interleukin-1 receptor domain-containing protein, partial [Vicinamibacteria bacterium]